MANIIDNIGKWLSGIDFGWLIIIVIFLYCTGSAETGIFV
jgi:hypothetical protein